MELLRIYGNLFHLINHLPGCYKYLHFIMPLCHFIEELYNVSKVHVPNNNVSYVGNLFLANFISQKFVTFYNINYKKGRAVQQTIELDKI